MGQRDGTKARWEGHRESLQGVITKWYSHLSDTAKVTIDTISIVSLPLPPPHPVDLSTTPLLMDQHMEQVSHTLREGSIGNSHASTDEVQLQLGEDI